MKGHESRNTCMYRMGRYVIADGGKPDGRDKQFKTQTTLEKPGRPSLVKCVKLTLEALSDQIERHFDILSVSLSSFSECPE